MAELPPSYSRVAEMGQITYTTPSAPSEPSVFQNYGEITPGELKNSVNVGPQMSPGQPLASTLQQDGRSTLQQDGRRATRTVVVQQPRPSGSSWTLILTVLMWSITLFFIPLGAVLWYYGATSSRDDIKIAGILLQAVSFVVVELLQLLWYVTEKNAFFRANIAILSRP